jgi:hypothetical protein
LFEYEKKPLTQKSLQQLAKKAGVEEKSSLFSFDDGTTNPNPLKAGDCKAFPGDAEWPSQCAWKTFNKLLGGALIDTVPIAAPCYKNLGVYDAEKCAAVRNSYADPYFQ